MNQIQAADKSFARRLVSVFFLTLPVFYLSAILAVTGHEVIGHGMTAVLAGAPFTGFGIGLDGMGWANVRAENLGRTALTTMLAGGAAFTTLFFIVFLILAMVFRKKTLLHLTLIILAFSFMIDGSPYYFWDSIMLGGIGDFSMLYNLHPDGFLRAVIMTISGILMLSTIAIFNKLYYLAVCSLVRTETSGKRESIGIALFIFFQQVIYWFAFDWNQIVPGAGLLPTITGLVTALITLAVLVITRGSGENHETAIAEKNFKKFMIIEWTVCIAVIVVIAVWLQNGVNF